MIPATSAKKMAATYTWKVPHWSRARGHWHGDVQSSKDKRNGNEEYSTFPVTDEEEFTWTFLGKEYAATESLTYPALLLSCVFFWVVILMMMTSCLAKMVFKFELCESEQRVSSLRCEVSTRCSRRGESANNYSILSVEAPKWQSD